MKTLLSLSIGACAGFFSPLLTLSAAEIKTSVIPAVVAAPEYGGVILRACGENHAQAAILTADPANLAPGEVLIQQLYTLLSQGAAAADISALFEAPDPDEISQLQAAIAPGNFSTLDYVFGRTYQFATRSIAFCFGKDKTSGEMVTFYIHEISSATPPKLKGSVAFDEATVLVLNSIEHSLNNHTQPATLPSHPREYPVEEGAAGGCALALQFDFKHVNAKVNELDDTQPTQVFLKQVQSLYASGTPEQIADLWAGEDSDEDSEKIAIQQQLSVNGVTDQFKAEYGDPDLRLRFQIGAGDSAVFYLERPNSSVYTIMVAMKNAAGNYKMTYGLCDLGPAVPGFDRNILKILASEQFIAQLKTAAGI
jgi:hypothetical protein